MGNKAKISTAADGRKSGRAVFDNQGRASWEWQTATGVFETDVTNEQMQNLEAAGLALVESEPKAVSHGRVWTAASHPVTRTASAAAPARNPTVLKRLLRRLAG
ncbi:MAG TPA: hypothetical protein VH814_18875 [Steroidobacteraceae bacterium]|jgi:hypothetical protein